MDVIQVLQKLSDLNLIRLNKPIGSWYSIYCPIHNDGQERRPSCGVLLHEEVRNGQRYPEGWVHCFACGLAKTLPDLIGEILKNKNITTQSGLEWLKENIPGFEEQEFDYLLPRDLVQELNSSFAVDYVKGRTLKPTAYVSEDELQKYRFTVPYMYERRLTDEVIEKFDVGVDLKYIPNNRIKPVPCITFPVRDISGNTLFVYRRAIKTKNFYMPQGIEKPIYGLYELPSSTSSVIICESIFNALTCYVYGYPAIALFGTGTQPQIQTLQRMGIKEFILGLDPDEAGARGQAKLRRALKSTAVIRSLEYLDNRDINELEKEEFLDLLDRRV